MNNKFPPYPEGFKMPLEIMDKWDYRGYKCLDTLTEMPIIRGRIPRILNIGDRFNGVVIGRKRKKGLVYPNRHHRTPQFIFPPYKLSGQILFDESLSGAEIIEKGKLRKGEVHRFEIVSILPEKYIFYCVPLKGVFDNNNSYYNLTNCNYKER